MRMILLVLVLFVSGVVSADWKDLSVKNGCSVYDTKGDVKIYPGTMCLFLDDGTFISAGLTGLRRFNRDQTIIWESAGRYHHQINLSGDKKRVLGILTENTLRGNIRERDDIILIHDLETGKILHRKLARDILTENKIVPLNWRNTPFIKDNNADLETSHFNSIYEIPENKGEKKAPYLKAGNIIINSVVLGIFILSPDLKQTLYSKIADFSYLHHIHDVQVSPSGDILLFNNMVKDPGENFFYSAINKYDPVTDKVTFQYTSNPKAFFFSPVCGGVQEIDDDLLYFSHVMDGGFLLSRKQNKIIFTTPGTNGNIYIQTSTQQLKLIDLRKFQENSK